MNERKSFQIQKNIADNKNMIYGNKKEFYQQYNKKKSNEVSKKDIKSLKNKNGITLIALVISIIVMLILAGVSLNATIGDNGIITQAQNATYMQSIAALEEYLQTEYVKYYDETENYTSKIELLSSKLGNLCLKDGTKNYITYDGKMYYLINKQALPDDVKNQLRGGDTTEYLKYIRLQDVYGVTPDLKVYYCESGTDSALGTLDSTELDPNTPLKKINQDAEMKSAITEALASVGVTVGEDGVTVGDASKLKTVTIDGSKHNITSISGLSEISTLQNLELKDVKIDNLDGIEVCTKLNYILFDNCIINNYSNIANVLGLKYLYMYLPPAMSETNANTQVSNLSLGMKNAKDMNKLEYVGIFGENYLKENYAVGLDGRDIMAVTSTKKSNLTDIFSLNDWANSVKQSIKYMYLNNNSFNNIEALKEYSNIYELWIFNNKNLLTLKGLDNHKNLKYIAMQNCNLQSISDLNGCSSLYYISVFENNNLTSLSGIESSSIYKILAWACNFGDISALNGTSNNGISTLTYLNLGNNTRLQDVDSISKCTSINNLYLSGCENMNDAGVIKLEKIIMQCGTNYSLPIKYNMLFSNLTSYDYTSVGLTDTSREITALKNRTKIEWLRLYGNTRLGNSRIAQLLKDGYLDIEELSTIENNLTLTEEQKNYINSLKSKGINVIKNMSDTEIQNMENANDIYIRYILSTLTGLKKLSIGEITNIKSLDFLNTVTGLYELDIRSTGISDISILEQKELSLGTLAIDNPNLDLSTIQLTLERLYVNYQNGNNTKSVWNNSVYNDVRNAGLILINGDFTNAFKNCKTVSKLKINSNKNLDLTNCENLTNLFVTYGHVKTPNVKMQSVCCYYDKIDASQTPSIEYMNFGENRSAESSFDGLKNTAITDLFLGYFICTDLNGLKNLQASKNTLVSLRNRSDFSSYYYREQTGDLSVLSEFTNLKIIHIAGAKNSNVLNGASQLKAVEELVVSSNNINDIRELANLTTLKTLKLKDNKISDISSLKNLTNLNSLDLGSNVITDITDLGNLVSNTRNLKNLFINDNLLENYSAKGNNNIEVIKKLKDSGVTVNYSNNNFSDTSEID